MTYTAKIRAKGLEATGVTEEIAKQMYASLGQTTMAVVELAHVEHSDTSAGDHAVSLTIELLEPSQSDRMTNHLRELARAAYLERRKAQGDTIPDLDAELGGSLDEVVTAGESQLDRHPDGGVAGVWDGSMDDATPPLTPGTDDDKVTHLADKKSRKT